MIRRLLGSIKLMLITLFTLKVNGFAITSLATLRSPKMKKLTEEKGKLPIYLYSLCEIVSRYK